MIIEIGSLIGALGTITAAIYTIFKLIVKPTIGTFKKIRKAFETIETIQAELTPNGGSSLCDTINRIEVGILFEQHARRATAMILHVGVFETNKDGDCVWINKKYSEISGQNLEEARGFGWINGILSEDRERVKKEWEDAIKQSRVLNTELQFVASNPFEPNSDRTITKSLIHAVPVINTKKKLLGYVGIVSPLEGNNK